MQFHLSDTLLKEGRSAEAEQFCRKAIAAKTKVFGAGHPWVVSSNAKLGNILLAQGKRAEAIDHLNSTWEAVKKFPNANGVQMGDLASTIGNIYMNEGNYAEAARYFEQSSTAVSLINLGWLYLEGKGVKQDYKIAHEFTLKAAQRGNGPAQNNLGTMYEDGRGVTKDLPTAIDWFRRSVTNGCILGMWNLAMHYESGEGVNKDINEAAKLYEKMRTHPSTKSDDRACNAVAWFFATCPVAELRNGTNAVTMAEHANLLTHRTNDVYLDTLAAAYAEAGNFTNAVSAQRKAMTLLKDEKAKADFATRLKLYEANIPYHSTN